MKAFSLYDSFGFLKYYVDLKSRKMYIPPEETVIIRLADNKLYNLSDWNIASKYHPMHRHNSNNNYNSEKIHVCHSHKNIYFQDDLACRKYKIEISNIYNNQVAWVNKYNMEDKLVTTVFCELSPDKKA